MAQESLNEKKQLETLEQAAAQATRPEQPEQIAEKASEVNEERRAGLAWALPYFIAAIVAGVLRSCT